MLDGYNGVVMRPDSTEAVTVALARISPATPDERRAMAEGEHARWPGSTHPTAGPSNLLRRLPQLRSAAGLCPAPWTSRDHV